MPAVIDVTHAGPIRGGWAQTIWESAAHQPDVTVSEGSVYAVSEHQPKWRLEHTATGWLSSDLVTGIFGYGSTPGDAIVDLVHALREHRDVLERQDALTPDLADHLAYLQRD
jgi:hypothetical protein